MGTTKIPSECLWRGGWPVWGFVGVELVQSSSSPPQPKIASYAPAQWALNRLFALQTAMVNHKISCTNDSCYGQFRHHCS